ncbi:MAG: hypothetical protein HY520_02020 [Candidatus Aenigmarchaeota archaeon]|nr:hypothetical protein [Candidatus Aenigmarchaeota archaeon]
MARRRGSGQRRRTVSQETVILTVIVLAVGIGVFAGNAANPVWQAGAAAGQAFQVGKAAPSPTIIAPGNYSFCRDSDGATLSTRGSCQDARGSKTDYCWDNASVVEFTCASKKCVQNIYNCANYGFTGGCVNGACVNSNQTHLECRSNTCSIVQGPGSNQCSPAGSSCGGNQTNQTHLACVANTCTLVAGNGTNACSPAGSSCNGSNSSLPDLVVFSLTASWNNGSNTSNSSNVSVTISAAIRNQGTAAAGVSTTRITLSPNIGSVFLSTGALAPGQQTTVGQVYQLAHNTYTAIATADVFNVVVESSETNNDKTTVFTI